MADLTGNFKPLTDLEIEFAVVKRGQEDVLVDLLDLVVGVASVQGTALRHCHVPLKRSDPFLQRLCFLVDVNTGVLGLLKQFPNLRRFMLLLESDVVLVAVRKELPLVRLNRLLGVLDELDDVLGSVHLPQNVLYDRMIFQHWQHFQIVLVLAEELLPEGQTVDPLALHRRRCSITWRLLFLVPLNKTCGHEEPFEGLNSHKGVIVEDWQVLDLELGLVEGGTSLL